MSNQVYENEDRIIAPLRTIYHHDPATYVVGSLASTPFTTYTVKVPPGRYLVYVRMVMLRSDASAQWGYSALVAPDVGPTALPILPTSTTASVNIVDQYTISGDAIVTVLEGGSQMTFSVNGTVVGLGTISLVHWDLKIVQAFQSYL